MSSIQASGKLRPPSEAYLEATCSLVYRLSELMFGSLLAAYSLGFVGAIAAYGSQLSDHGNWGIVLLTVQYASISVTFAYLTTSFYLTYHVGILTMPQLSFARLGTDFSIAIGQAVFFGMSMLQPALLPVVLGINVLISSKRKDKEYASLASRLFNASWPVEGRDDHRQLKYFRQKLAKLLRDEFPKLKGWTPIGWGIQVGAWLAVTVGVIVFSLTQVDALQNSINWGADKWFSQQLVIAIEVVLATSVITIYGSRVLGQRASFLGFVKNPNFYGEQPDANVKNLASPDDEKPKAEKRSPMDEEFLRLQSRLKERCDEWLKEWFDAS